MGEDILSWMDSTLQDSQLRWEFHRSRMPEDPENWSELFAASLEEDPAPTGCGMLLTGADSLSKQAAAVGMLALLKKQGYEGVFLDGTELGESGAAQAKARLNGLLDRFHDQGQGLCLVVEGMEECPCRREILNFLALRLCEYQLYRDELMPMYLILLDDGEQTLPTLLLENLRLYRTALPDRSRRAAYLKQHGRSLRDYMSMKTFNRATEGASYGQLRSMIAAAGYLVDSRDGRALTDEELTDFLAGQMPPFGSEDALQSLCQSMQQLTDQLPKLLQEAAAARPVPVVTPAPVPQTQLSGPADQGKFLADKRQEIEQMPPRDLAIELFGEQAVADMQNMVQAIPQ